MGGFAKRDQRDLHSGPVIGLVETVWESPDGELMEREVVKHPGAVSVVPLLDDGTVVMVRQFRAAVEGDLLEIPAGKRDKPGEPPELTAHRELAEEIGYAANRMDRLGAFYNSPGFCDEFSHVFLARDLEPVPADAQGPEERHMTIEMVPLDDVPRLIASGELIDAKSQIGLLLALRELGR